MTTRESLTRCVGVMHQNFGPVSGKTAAERYFNGLTQPVRDDEVLGSKFVKLARAQGIDPWEMAFQVAQGYDNLVKTAEFLPLSKYYVEWANDFEKTAVPAFLANLAGGLYRRGQKVIGAVSGAVGKRSMGAVGRAADTTAVRAAGNVEKSLAAHEGRAFEQQSKKMLNQTQKAQRQAQKELAVAQKGQLKNLTPEERVAFREQQAAKAAPKPAAPAPAAPVTDAATPAATTAAPVTQAAPAAAPTNWGHAAVGAGALGVLGAGAYGLSRAVKKPAQPQFAEPQFAG